MHFHSYQCNYLDKTIATKKGDAFLKEMAYLHPRSGADKRYRRYNRNIQEINRTTIVVRIVNNLQPLLLIEEAADAAAI